MNPLLKLNADWRKVAAPALIALSLVGCNDAEVASKNISTAADNFEVNRRVVFYNGITDTYMLVVEGRCSIEVDSSKDKLDVICKTGPNQYKKHFLGKSDNVTYFVEQLEGIEASTYHYRVEFKPQAIVPDVRVRGNASELGKSLTPR